MTRPARSSRRCLVLVLGLAGCCGDGGEGSLGTFKVSNGTPYFLHVLQPDHARLYLPPGGTDSVELRGNGTVSLVVAAGQNAEGRATSTLSCCEQRCGELTASWLDETLSVAHQPPQDCPGGSCPYVYTWDGRQWTREAEMLVGALNPGAEREDGLVLEHGTAAADRYRVRISTELKETAFLDQVRLELWDRRPGIELALDEPGRPVSVQDARPALAIADALGRPSPLEARADEVRAALTRSDPAFGSYRLTRFLDFAAPAARSEPVVLLRVQNTAFLQDTYHRYMEQFGPGLPRIMRWMSDRSAYRATLDRILHGGGFGLEVAIQDREAYRPVGTLAPVGIAGPKTVAVILPAVTSPSGRTRLRLRMLPAAWTVHAVRLGSRAGSLPGRRTVNPSAARWRRPPAPPRDLSLAPLLHRDGRHVEVGVGEHLEVDFPGPGVSPDRASLAVLRLTGHYEERRRLARPCVRWGLLRRCLREDNAFARFALERLARGLVPVPGARPPGGGRP